MTVRMHYEGYPRFSDIDTLDFARFTGATGIAPAFGPDKFIPATSDVFDRLGGTLIDYAWMLGVSPQTIAPLNTFHGNAARMGIVKKRQFRERGSPASITWSVLCRDRCRAQEYVYRPANIAQDFPEADGKITALPNIPLYYTRSRVENFTWDYLVQSIAYTNDHFPVMGQAADVIMDFGGTTETHRITPTVDWCTDTPWQPQGNPFIFPVSVSKLSGNELWVTREVVLVWATRSSQLYVGAYWGRIVGVEGGQYTTTRGTSYVNTVLTAVTTTQTEKTTRRATEVTSGASVLAITELIGKADNPIVMAQVPTSAYGGSPAKATLRLPIQVPKFHENVLTLTADKDQLRSWFIDVDVYDVRFSDGRYPVLRGAVCALIGNIALPVQYSDTSSGSYAGTGKAGTITATSGNAQPLDNARSQFVHDGMLFSALTARRGDDAFVMTNSLPIWWDGVNNANSAIHPAKRIVATMMAFPNGVTLHGVQPNITDTRQPYPAFGPSDWIGGYLRDKVLLRVDPNDSGLIQVAPGGPAYTRPLLTPTIPSGSLTSDWSPMQLPRSWDDNATYGTVRSRGWRDFGVRGVVPYTLDTETRRSPPTHATNSAGTHWPALPWAKSTTSVDFMENEGSVRVRRYVPQGLRTAMQDTPFPSVTLQQAAVYAPWQISLVPCQTMPSDPAERTRSLVYDYSRGVLHRHLWGTGLGGAPIVVVDPVFRFYCPTHRFTGADVLTATMDRNRTGSDS